MARINRRKKLVRVLKRKWFKPAVYTVFMSVLIYLAISNTVIQKKKIDDNVPHFLITRITDKFDETEYMHLLLTVQEISRSIEVADQLKVFVNKPYPVGCPKLLVRQLNKMNWEPKAFHVRVKRMFQLLEIYERIVHLDETIAFLKVEIREKRLPPEMESQVYILQQERDKIVGDEISEAEFNFIKGYNGLIQRLKNI